jgi:hypothetical protein
MRVRYQRLRGRATESVDRVGVVADHRSMSSFAALLRDRARHAGDRRHLLFEDATWTLGETYGAACPRAVRGRAPRRQEAEA